MCGADTVVEAIELYEQLKIAFNSAGFNIRNFFSNSTQFLEHLPREDEELKKFSVSKALGVVWSPSDDTFEQEYNFSNDVVPTKRGLQSEIAALFDPLGIISPIL